MAFQLYILNPPPPSLEDQDKEDRILRRETRVSLLKSVKCLNAFNALPMNVGEREMLNWKDMHSVGYPILASVSEEYTSALPECFKE